MSLVRAVSLLALTLAGLPLDADARSLYGDVRMALVSDFDLAAEPPAARAVGALVRVWAFFDGIEDHVDAAALCSAVAVSPRHVLTNHHCKTFGYATDLFFQGHVARAASAPSLRWIPDGAPADATVWLAFDGDTVADPRAHVKDAFGRGTPLHRDSALDFAVFEVSEMDTAAVVDLRSVAADAGSLTLYAHPAGMPLTRSDGCSVRRIAAPFVYHDCDSLSSSSGGLLLDEASGVPYALHHRGAGPNAWGVFSATGVAETPDDLARAYCARRHPVGTADFAACADEYAFNRAIPLDAIRDALERDAPEVAAALDRANDEARL